MPTHTIGMAALLVFLSVAPAAAGRQPMAGMTHDRSGCPHQNARAGAGNASATPAQAAAGGKVMRITLPDRVGGPLFNLDRRSSAFDL